MIFEEFVCVCVPHFHLIDTIDTHLCKQDVSNQGSYNAGDPSYQHLLLSNHQFQCVQHTIMTAESGVVVMQVWILLLKISFHM